MPIDIPKSPQPSAYACRCLAEAVGHELPGSYVAFVGDHDGAAPATNSFIIRDNEVSVSRFIPVEEAVSLGKEINGFPQGVIPFAEDDCGNYFYVEPRSGSVWFWDHETEGADEQVALDALGFEASLMPLDSEVKLAPGQVRHAWVNPSFKPEF